MNLPEVKVYTGGLMRCCVETLAEFMENATELPKEGYVLPCKYHPEDNSMIFRDGAWHWNEGGSESRSEA